MRFKKGSNVKLKIKPDSPTYTVVNVKRITDFKGTGMVTIYILDGLPMHFRAYELEAI
jgi:hypothetical protein